MKKLIALVAVCLICVSCDVMNQVAETANLVRKCKFSLDNVQNVTLAGINLKNINTSSLTATNVAKLGAALLTKNLPLNMTVNVGIQNPTTKPASLNAMDWKVAIDNVDRVSGTTNKKVSVPSKSKTAMPLSFNINTYDVFSKDGISAVKNFVSSFSQKDATSSRVAIKVNPTVAIGSQSLKLGYMTLSKQVN
jgi:LEA14-like dessication related protein